MSLRARLRAATQPVHDRLEARFEQQRRDWTRAGYASSLLGALGFYRPVEAALGGLDWAASGIDIASRMKSRWLEADLAALGADARAVDICPDAPSPASLDDAFGVLYVLEGATLGGTVISKQLQRNFGLDAGNGARFFAGYGEETGAMWRGFQLALERRATDPAAGEAAEHAAVATFLAYEHWMTSAATGAAREPAVVARISHG